MEAESPPPWAPAFRAFAAAKNADILFYILQLSIKFKCIIDFLVYILFNIYAKELIEVNFI